MNETSVIAIIDAIAAKFGIIVDWTSQNVLPYLEQLMHRIVSYEIGINIFWMIFCPIMAIGFGILGYNLVKKAFERYGDDDWCEHFLGVAGCVCSLIAVCWTIAALVVIPCGVIRIIECINIPEKIFFEYIGALAS